ncbi:MAG: cob(I)yrinic acid a,c-diamide adenosyltransferase [Ignavibacteria bacterium RBG_13_36_8]|nr:MAG: cob(I)yrinic acid a,c-diamide adenosyltransferase [Ignavibacteria bacterium RBG_13_36_8]
MGHLEKGYVQVYTGNGKGKTTAALGQALRAVGHGLKTYIAQFMKDYPYNELLGLKYLSEWITIEQFCGDDFVLKKVSPSKDEIRKAKEGLSKAKGKMLSGEFDIIILDEICVSIYFKLLTVEDVLPLIQIKPKNVELILTGRYCPQELIDKADLVTEMKEVKHYFQKGVSARKGIES